MAKQRNGLLCYGHMPPSTGHNTEDGSGLRVLIEPGHGDKMNMSNKGRSINGHCLGKAAIEIMGGGHRFV